MNIYAFRAQFIQLEAFKKEPIIRFPNIIWFQADLAFWLWHVEGRMERNQCFLIHLIQDHQEDSNVRRVRGRFSNKLL